MSIRDSIISRVNWGARYAPDRTLSLGQKTEMHVHHSVMKCPGPGSCAATIRTIERQHHDQWGFSVGYNVLRCHDGFFEGAGLLRRGQHCPNHNTSSFGVCYVGDGREPLPAYFGYDLVSDLDNLWDELSNWRGMRLYLYGHRDHRQTNCPGDVLYHEVHYKFPGAATLVPVPPPPAPEPVLPPPPADDGTYPLENVMQNPVITEGSAGHHARIVQSLLIAHAPDVVAYVMGGWENNGNFVDGDFGSRSKAVLVEWQKRTEVLVPDGICGPKSWAWLCGLPVG